MHFQADQEGGRWKVTMLIESSLNPATMLVSKSLLEGFGGSLVRKATLLEKEMFLLSMAHEHCCVWLPLISGSWSDIVIQLS